MCRKHHFKMMEVTGLLPFLHLRNYLKNLSTPVKLSLVSLCPSWLVSGTSHLSFLKIPPSSTASHFDQSFMVSLEGIYLPRHALLALLWGNFSFSSSTVSTGQTLTLVQRDVSAQAPRPQGKEQNWEHLPHTYGSAQGSCQHHHPPPRSSSEPCSGSCWLCSSSRLQIVLNKE